MRLVTALEETCSQVDVEKFKSGFGVFWFDCDFEATARFVTTARQIVISIGDDRESAENSIPVGAAS